MQVQIKAKIEQCKFNSENSGSFLAVSNRILAVFQQFSSSISALKKTEIK